MIFAVAKRDIRGLNTLRFCAAVWVALSHGLVPLGSYSVQTTGLIHIALAIYNLAFNGVAAVLVFFVISGVCIHYPFACGAPFRTVPFLVRRIVRISLPVMAVTIIASRFGSAARGALAAVLWSVYCEMAYYAIYPVLRRVFVRVGIAPTVVVSFAAALIVLLLHWHVRYHWDMPLILTCIIGLPAWLLGCLLAQRVTANAPARAMSTPRIWLWRFSVWLYTVLALWFFYHGPIRVGHPALLLPFYFLCYHWIFAEIVYWNKHVPLRFLESGGAWSYSLYLVHNIVIALTPISAIAVWREGALRLILVPLAALVFYGVVEWPSHRLARELSRRANDYLQAWRARAAPTV